MNYKNYIPKLFCMSVVLGSFTACGGGSDNGEAFFQVLHASPDAPAVDVLVDEEVVLSSVAYKESSGYLHAEDGERMFSINAAGTSTSVIEAMLDLKEGLYYSIYAVNKLSSIEPIVIVDDRTAPAAGNARIRVAHLAPSAPEVDVYVTEPGADLAGAIPVLTTVPFKAVSGYLEIAGGNYQIRVTLAGTKTVAIDTGSLVVKPGIIVTAAAMDAVGGYAPFSLILISDN